MKVASLNTGKLTHGESLSFLGGASQIFRANHSTETPIPFLPKIEDLEAKTEKMKTLYYFNRKSEKTKVLGELDKVRAGCTIGMRETLRIFSVHHVDEDIKQKAQLLLEVFLHYGTRIDKNNYQEETAIISSLVSDIESDDNLLAIVHELHLTKWFETLKAKNAEFAQLYVERDLEASDRPQEKLADVRSEGEAAYKKVVNKLNAYAEIEGGIYNEIIADLNSHIERYKPLTLPGKKKAATEMNTIPQTEIETNENLPEEAPDTK